MEMRRPPAVRTDNTKSKENVMSKSRRNRESLGFTLVELLVVIGIIALLAAILMPSLSSARELAKSASCLSNLRNIGASVGVYAADNRGFFPSSYSYINGDSSAGGYRHWTAGLTPSEYTDPVNAGKYPKNAEQFVCPSNPVGGWAPSNFTATRIPNPPAGQASQNSSIDDQQAPRLSYVANEILMPRKKYSSSHDLATPPGTSNLCVVSTDAVESASHTILLAEFSDSANCIWGSSTGGGDGLQEPPSHQRRQERPGGRRIRRRGLHPRHAGP
jgi:prepilin-type N-terminal cleavage/methylation domain-containing protein